MFEALIESTERKPSNRWINFLAAGLFQLSVLSGLFLLSILIPENITNLRVIFTPSPLAGPVTGDSQSRESVRNRAGGRRPGKLLESPNRVPDQSQIIGDPPPLAYGCNDCFDTDLEPNLGSQGIAEDNPPNVGTTLLMNHPAVPHPVDVPRQPHRPVPVGGDVQSAKLVFHPNPIYPPSAIATRVQGIVVIEALISRHGSIEQLRVLSGHPLLIPAALEAVKQWRYQPTFLNGEPVEVETIISVSFRLG